MVNLHLSRSLDNSSELLVCNGVEDNNHFSFFGASLYSQIQVLADSVADSNEFTVPNSDMDC